MPHWLLVSFWLLLLVAAGSVVLWTIINGISPMPTSRKVKDAVLGVTDLHGKIYELGAGWGTLLFPLAKKYPESCVVGYETSPLPFVACKIRKVFGRYENVSVVRNDFFEVNLSDADCVVCYLYPKAMERLKRKFEQELRQGTIVVSHTFAVPGWQPIKVVEVDDLYKTKVYVYEVV